MQRSMPRCVSLNSDRYRPLEPGEDRILFDRFRNGDKCAGDELVCRSMRYAVKIALRFGCPPLESSEAIQEAFIGLLDARRRFDPERGSFMACAGWSIRGRLEAAIRGARVYSESTVSLNAPADGDSEKELIDLLASELSTPEDEASARLDTAHCLRPVPEREGKVLYLRYGCNAQWDEVGEEVGLSRQGAQQLAGRAMKRVRRYLLAG